MFIFISIRFGTRTRFSQQAEERSGLGLGEGENPVPVRTIMLEKACGAGQRLITVTQTISIEISSDFLARVFYIMRLYSSSDILRLFPIVLKQFKGAR
jgi:hypothetical protein